MTDREKHGSPAEGGAPLSTTAKRVMTWLQKRYRGQKEFEKTNKDLGPILLAARALHLSERQRAELALDKAFGLSAGAGRLLKADVYQGEPDLDRIWAGILRADARGRSDVPPKWDLPVKIEGISRLVHAAENSGMPFERFADFITRTKRVSEEARQTMFVSAEELRRAVEEFEETDDQSGGDASETEEYSEEQAAKIAPRPAVIAAQQRSGLESFPEELRPWVQHVEDLVMQSIVGILTVNANRGGEDDEMEDMDITGFAVDLHHDEQGVQWGYTPTGKTEAGEAISRLLANGRWASATLRVLTGERDELLHFPLKESRGWSLHLGSGETPATGVSAEEAMVACETDPETGLRTLTPEFGVRFVDSQDVEANNYGH